MQTHIYINPESRPAISDDRYGISHYIYLGYFNEGIFLHFCASMISGLVTTAASMPVDIAKTRIQNMKIIDGKPEYKGAVVSVQNCSNFRAVFCHSPSHLFIIYISAVDKNGFESVA